MEIDDFVHDAPAVRVVFGNGRIRTLAAEVERHGSRRVLLVGGGHASGFVDRAAADLGDKVVGRFAHVVLNVPDEVAREATRVAIESRAQIIVAIGGGSTIGTAKAISHELGLCIIAVPTTYSGSELTAVWGITRHGHGITGLDPLVRPVSVIYDPELTLDLPTGMSVNSAMSAMAHLVEGLYAPQVGPLTALTAEEGVRALVSSLPRVAVEPRDLSARAEALHGASFGGWTLATTGMGVHHKICQALTGTLGLPHAETHSAVLPHVTAFNAEVVPAAMERLLRAFAAAGRPISDPATGLWDLAHEIGANTSLRALGLPQSELDGVAAQVVAAQPVNPRPIDFASVRAIIAQAYAGARPCEP
ncbi:maleylacetate reductase [Ammonicoccus fulvus]|uniref:Maleylacetate reductase n=1 Tax=Ammonicoccus fulvus TaxID=3138240 RepID=A0ABZ3FSW8_9ACTN